MAEFEVIVQGPQATERYRIHDRMHNDTAAHAAQKAIASYMRHGHTQFPHNDGPLTIAVKEVPDAP